MSNTASLTPEQSKALFDVLTHWETYKEIEDFKYPGAIHNYGPPFQDESTKIQAPILQSLLCKFVLPLPGMRDVSPEFWKEYVENLIQDLSEAELSESYDKGFLGIRKTLATAISALVEYPARGSLGGFPKQERDPNREYDVNDPEDVLQAWKDCIQEIVYGDLIDRTIAKVEESDDLLQHEPMVQGLHEFIIVNLASLMHYTLVLSPEGPTLIRMIDNVHKLLPYILVRQTLKIGNVATMLSSLLRIALAKLSVASMTNWIGLSSGANEGMNLMQQIISQILHWDKRDLRKRAESIERDKDAPPKEVRDELKNWIQRSRAEHEECRKASKLQGMSIVAIILALSSVSSDLSEPQHANAIEYLSIHLAIRDRQEITKVLCHRNPDILTAAVKHAFDAYTPMIRRIHEAVYLSDTLWDFERFVTDMLKIAKPSQGKGPAKSPSVEGFVDLLHRHQYSCHKFLHQVAKNGKEVTSWWRDYVHLAASHFRRNETPPASLSLVSPTMSTGGIQTGLENAFNNLSARDQEAVKTELDAHKNYIDDLHEASAARIRAVINRWHSTPFGPGAYLARWQQLMDNTAITPKGFQGPVRYGTNKKFDHSDIPEDELDPAHEIKFRAESQAENIVSRSLPTPSKAETTLTLLGNKFRELLVSQ